jgi:hypothetical protein
MRLRPSSLYDVLALISFFLVVGGGTALASYVISSNSQVGPGTISGHHPSGGKHANLISRSITGQDVQINGLTGAQIKETTLSAVPNASRLGGLGPAAFLPSTAVRRFGPISVVRPGHNLPFVTLINVGSAKLTAACPGDGSTVLNLTTSVAHSAAVYSAPVEESTLARQNALEQVRIPDMTAGQAYPLQDGLPGLVEVSGALVTPSGHQVVFEVYADSGIAGQPTNHCLAGGYAVVS